MKRRTLYPDHLPIRTNWYTQSIVSWTSSLEIKDSRNRVCKWPFVELAGTSLWEMGTFGFGVLVFFFSKTSFKMNYLFISMLSVYLPACLCTSCMQCSWRPEEGAGSLGTGVNTWLWATTQLQHTKARSSSQASNPGNGYIYVLASTDWVGRDLPRED